MKYRHQTGTRSGISLRERQQPKRTGRKDPEIQTTVPAYNSRR